MCGHGMALQAVSYFRAAGARGTEKEAAWNARLDAYAAAHPEKVTICSKCERRVVWGFELNLSLLHGCG